MRADESDATPGNLSGRPACNLVLTNSAADLSCRGNDDVDFQGNYDYHAHAQVYMGGADPLGSQGYANAVRQSFKLLNAAREAKSLRAFLFWGGEHTEGADRNL